jgi:hypothetical protein
MDDKPQALRWSPEIVQRVAGAIGRELYGADLPGNGNGEFIREFLQAALLCGAAAALQRIGEEIAKGSGNAYVMNLPDPKAVSPWVEIDEGQ